MWTTTKMVCVSFTTRVHHAQRVYRYTEEEVEAAQAAMNEGVSKRLPMIMEDIEVLEYIEDALQIT